MKLFSKTTAAILSASFTKIGIGCYESSGVLYRSQFFIG